VGVKDHADRRVESALRSGKRGTGRDIARRLAPDPFTSDLRPG